MAWGAAGSPEGGGRSVRADGIAATHVDEDAIRTANQMREAGLKWRPAMVPPIAWIALALVVLSVIYVYLR